MWLVTCSCATSTHGCELEFGRLGPPSKGDRPLTLLLNSMILGKGISDLTQTALHIWLAEVTWEIQGQEHQTCGSGIGVSVTTAKHRPENLTLCCAIELISCSVRCEMRCQAHFVTSVLCPMRCRPNLSARCQCRCQADASMPRCQSVSVGVSQCLDAGRCQSNTHFFIKITKFIQEPMIFYYK